MTETGYGFNLQDGDWTRVRQLFQMIGSSLRLGPTSTPTFGGISLGFGDLVSEQNPDPANAIRIKGTSSDVDVVLGSASGYFSVYNAADDTNVFNVSDRGNTVIAGDLTVDTNTLFVDAGNDRVGIGTISPDELLHVGGGNILLDNTQQVRIKDAGGTENNALTLTSASHTDELLLGAGSGIDNLSLSTGGTRRLFINNSGDVGIGTVTPSVLLDVNGALQATTINAFSLGGKLTGGANEIEGSAFDINGGTIDGITALNLATNTTIDINSDVFISNAGTGNLLIGIDAGEGNSADYCTYIGYKTGENNTGNDGIFIGYQAGGDAVTGASNTCIGRNAGANLTSGGVNLALGANALLACTTTAYNIAIGSAAMQRCTGQRNIAIGYACLYGAAAGAVGSYNVGIGYNACGGVGGTSMDSNTTIGYESGAAITSADYNVCIGRGSGDSITTSSYNVMIGGTAGDGLVSGGGQTVHIGWAAGSSITTGQYNTIIGGAAGREAATGVNNCVLIGFSAGRDVANSDRLVIDNQDRGDAATTITNAILYGIMAAAPADQTLNINAVCNITENIQVDGTQVVTNQQAHITDAPGDTAANNATTINAILTALETHGLLADS